MTQPKQKPKIKLTRADYVEMTPPFPPGPRYQLINGELIEMAGPNDQHQVFVGEMYIAVTVQARELGIGQTRISPYDVAIDEFNTFQPDLLYVSNERRGIFDGHGVTGAPDVVVEVLSDSTRRRDLEEKLPVYGANGVREVWVVDLDAETVSKYVGDGQSLIPDAVYPADGTLTSQAMPGVEVPLGPIFARVRGAPASQN
jgi:Uma2 family endonuclease